MMKKLDGSNLCIFKLNGNIHIAQRKTILNIETELEENKGVLYKGLYEWLKEHLDYFKEHIMEGSVLCVTAWGLVLDGREYMRVV